MRFLIAGLGSIGRRHLRNIVALGQRDIMLFRTHQSTLPEEDLAVFPVETDLDVALAQKPDAVIIANPTALHLDIALPAAKAGCHLFIEKPVAAKWDEQVETLGRIVSQKRLKTLVGFQFRFHPVLAHIKELIASRQIGRLLSFRVHWGEYLPGWHPWEDYRLGYAARKDLGGGVVNTLSHPLDYVRWLFGEVESLSAMTGHVSGLDLDVEDVAEISLNLANEGLGSVHLDYFQRSPAHWIAVNCENGVIRWDNDTGAARIYHAEMGQWETIQPPEGFERNALFLDEMRHFLELVKDEMPSRCSLEDGIKALKMTEAVHNSAQKGCIIRL
ncbi:MAG: Gfo/Idh/MocA family oxidoreductase [Chloroflexota bacterium]|nr:Gfo/Idh/MocA family oxidoreductase [Chloroflexota bacterium]